MGANSISVRAQVSLALRRGGLHRGLSLAFLSMLSGYLAVVTRWGGGGGGDDISWQLPASGRDSGGIAAKCPAVTGALGVQCSPGAVTACTGYYEKRHPGRLLLEFP